MIASLSRLAAPAAAALLVAAAPPHAHAERVRLTNGDDLTGTIVEQTDDTVILQHPLLGPITLPADTVLSITPDPPTPPDAAEVPPAQPVPADDASPPDAASQDELPLNPTGLFGTGILTGWQHSLSIGVSGTDGNTDRFNFNAGLDSNFENPYHRWVFDASYFLAQDDGDNSQNEAHLGLNKDWLFPSTPWFYFAQAAYDYDDFEEWRQRASLFGGVGYTFIQRDSLEFVGRAGLGVNKEFGGDHELQPEALLGLDLIRWKINDAQTLTAGVTLYPDLGELGEYRATGNVEWKITVDAARNLSLKLGLEDEYESDPDGDDEHNDLKYYGALVLDF